MDAASDYIMAKHEFLGDLVTIKNIFCNTGICSWSVRRDIYDLITDRWCGNFAYVLLCPVSIGIRCGECCLQLCYARGITALGFLQRKRLPCAQYVLGGRWALNRYFTFTHVKLIHGILILTTTSLERPYILQDVRCIFSHGWTSKHVVHGFFEKYAQTDQIALQPRWIILGQYVLWRKSSGMHGNSRYCAVYRPSQLLTLCVRHLYVDVWLTKTAILDTEYHSSTVFWEVETEKQLRVWRTQTHPARVGPAFWR